MPRGITRPFEGYNELASPRLLDENWRELTFDLASSHNVLQDLVMPEGGGGYVYREAKIVGSATHNRFLYWRTASDMIELVEMSTEVVLDGNQVRICFTKSPIVDSVNVIEFSDSVVIMIATLTSVHRISLPHPKTTDKSILQDLTSDLLFNTANYYIIDSYNNSGAQQPLCATSWHEQCGSSDQETLKCAISFPDSSLTIVQFSRYSNFISSYDIKQIGIIGRLWSRIPNLLARSPNDCDNAALICLSYKNQGSNEVLLFALCRDWRLRIFSTNSKECVHTYNMVPQNSFSQSFSSHTNPTTELPMMKIYGSHLVIYLTSGRPEFVLLHYSYEDGLHELTERSTFQTPNWEKLVDFSVTEQRIWALAHVRETETALWYLDMRNILDGDEADIVWDFVNIDDDLETHSVKNYVAEIFWRNRFSITTIQKALMAFVGPALPRGGDLKSLEDLAHTRIFDDNQEEAWGRFYNYCIQNHHAANKPTGLIAASDESIVAIVKRSNPSFICPMLMSMDMILQGGPYRGIEFSPSIKGVIEPLNYISTEFMDDDHSYLFEQKLHDDPSNILDALDQILGSLLSERKVALPKFNSSHKNLIPSGIDFICDQLDLTSKAKEYEKKILEQISTRIKSDHNPLESNSGIILTFEQFRRLVRARMLLARDLLIYIRMIATVPESEKSSTVSKFFEDLYENLYETGKIRRLLDSLRSYSLLVWISETPVKTLPSHINSEVIKFLSRKFKYFNNCPKLGRYPENSLESIIYQNLFMNFLVSGGVQFAGKLSEVADHPQTLSSSFYVTEVSLNLCLLLWPSAGHLCFAEFLLTHHLDDHLDKYLDLADEWVNPCEADRLFIKASNCLIQKRAVQAVDIFNRLWFSISRTNIIGKFIDIDENPCTNQDERVTLNPALVHRYYDKLIQLFLIDNNYQCLVTLINHCMALLDERQNSEQEQWINCFRAKLFQYYLELEDSDEAYHTMVTTTDASLRINCLRKFIVHHCEKEQWANLLSYPYIDIKNDFIDILNQKADSSDLSKLNANDFYCTSYYDLLFSSYVSDEEYKRAADVMYNYAQRLAHEVPGIISIRKQADCLLTALNALKCVPEKEAYIDSSFAYSKDEGRSSVMKRSYDCESESCFDKSSPENTIVEATLNVTSKDVEQKYELTRARLRLLEKDQVANAIALSPLKVEEIIAQLVSSGMFSVAMDLAKLFKSPMEQILEGLTARYVFLIALNPLEVTEHQDLERGLLDVFTASYSIIDTYNYVANSTSNLAEKLWRLIDYYLLSFDGISHRYRSEAFSTTFSGTTVLMRVVAQKLLLSGYDIPASLRRLYMSRNTAELLKLLIKYDKLIDAAELAIEMVDRVLEPSNCCNFTSPFANDPPPIYLPTHLILLLISYLKEDATNTQHVKVGDSLIKKLNKFRQFTKES